MFVQYRIADDAIKHRPAVADRDTTDDAAVNQNQQPLTFTHHSSFTYHWPAGSRPEDVFASLIPGWDAAKASRIRIQLLAAQAEMISESPPEFPLKPTHTEGILPQKTINSPSGLNTSNKRGLYNPDSGGENIQVSLDLRKAKRIKSMGSDIKAMSVRSTGNPTEDYLVPRLHSFYQPFNRVPGYLKQKAQENHLPIYSEVPHSVEETPRSEQWRNSWRDLQMNIDRENLPLDWNPSPINFGESVTSPGTPTKSHYPTQLGDTGMREFAVIGESLVYDYSDDSDDNYDDGELECEFNLKAIRKTVKDAIKPLRRMQQREDPASKKLQDIVKIIVMRVLLDWIPSIHLVAPGTEYNGSLKDAHKCLIYAAKTMKWLDEAERGYGLTDLEYGVNVSLKSGKDGTVKEWKNVANYEPYGILIWIWRDLCLSVLLNDDITDGLGRAVVAYLLDNIRSSIPLETYDFLKKKEILSPWDLFLTGGSLVMVRSNSNGTKAPNPKYWPESFAKAKESLDHLYYINRLNELREYPSVDLYQAVKAMLPAEYQKKPLESIKTSSKASALEGQIDIFVFERATECLECLLQNNTLERSSKRFRDILVTFSSSKKAEAEWAYQQILIGFEEEVKVLSQELLRVFPNVHIATRLCEEEGVRVGTKRFFELAREGYVDGHCEDNVPKANYRHIFQAYLATGLAWNRGPKNLVRQNLLREMKRIFVSELGIIFELDKWVGKTLKRGCITYQAPELKIVLEYLLGNFGFEKIFTVKGVQTPKMARGRPPGSKNKARRIYVSTKRVSRGMAKVKVRRTTNIKLAESEEDGGDE